MILYQIVAFYKDPEDDLYTEFCQPKADFEEAKKILKDNMGLLANFFKDKVGESFKKELVEYRILKQEYDSN